MALSATQAREAAVAMAAAEPGLKPMSKTDLIAAVNAADQWATDNSASFNSALPVPFRTTATNAEKASLLAFVAQRRWAG